METREGQSTGPSEERSAPGQGGHQTKKAQVAKTTQAVKEAKQAGSK